MNIRARNILIFVLAALFALYFLYEAKNLLFGFSAKILFPRDGEAFKTSDVRVSGKVFEASRISLNGRQIFTDENGDFSEELILSTGLNIIELEAVNKFGRTIRDRRQVVVQ